MPLGSDEMRSIFKGTVIVRKPTYGIVSGYHELPYICLGKSLSAATGTTQVKGKVHVSPRFVIRPSHYEPSYGEIFGEDNVDVGIAGRVFGFLGFRNKAVECNSEYLEVRHLDASIDDLLGRNLDELERRRYGTGLQATVTQHFQPVLRGSHQPLHWPGQS